MNVAKNTNPICYGNKNDLGIFLCKIVAIIQRICRSSHGIATTVDPYHNRLFHVGFLVWPPYIQIQAILALIIKRPSLADVLFLYGTLSIVIGLIYAVIRHIFHRCFPAEFPNRWLAGKRDALIRNDISRLPAYEGAVYALYGK